MKNAQNNNTAAANNSVKEMFTMSNIRIAAATPVVAVSNGFLMAGEVTSKLAHFIAGEENWDKVLGHAYNDARVTGAVLSINTSDALAAAKAKMAAKKEEKADHSDMVEWKKGKWVPSEKATAAAKKAGYEQAFIPQMYKAANWLIRVAKEGGDKVYTTTQGETHTYLGWVFKAIFGHASFMEGKGVKNAKTAEKLAEYFEQACKHSRVAEDKLPTWEQVCAAVQAEQAAVRAEAHTEEATDDYQCEPGYAEETAEETRDGRAPKTQPATKVDVKGIVRALGIVRLKADNAFEVAERAKVAFEEARLTDEEFRAVVEACIAKDGGDPEEFYALMGEN